MDDSERDFSQEVVLEEDIRPLELTTNRENIFLTGATGFVGSHLLEELLKEKDVQIYCLCRPQSQNIFFQQLSNLSEHERKRIHIVLGDLAQPLLGMTQEQFTSLSGTIDLVYHCGAQVSLHGYEQMAKSTVNGTQEIIRLACQIKRKPLCYLSSVGVYMSSSNMAKDIFQEDDPLNNGKGLFGGYTQSKWVAEKIVHIARERGLPVVIFRPGRLVSDDSFPPKDNLWRVLSLFLKKGCVPDLNLVMGFVPVKLACKAIRFLMKQSTTFGRAFNFVNPHTITLQEIVDMLNRVGERIRIISSFDWKSSLPAGESALQIFTRPVFNELSYYECMQAFPDNKFSCKNAREALAQTGAFSFPKSHTIVETYVNYVNSPVF